MSPHSHHSYQSRSPVVQTIHTAVRGRGRYKIKSLQGSLSLKHYLELHLAAESGIVQVSANSDSGNVLVKFQPDLKHTAIAAAIERIVQDYKNQGRKRLGTLQHRHIDNGKTQPLPTRSQELGPSSTATQMLNPSVQVQEPENNTWYLWETKTVLTRFQTSATSGLSSQTAQAKLKQYGPNRLPEANPRSGFSILMDQFKSLPVALLVAAAGLSVATGGLVDALAILGVVGINAAIGYGTESQSEKIIHSLRHLVQPTAVVIRDGSPSEISAQDVVLGDILALKPGTYVAADARLIEAKRLSVDESALTGESMPVTKTAEPLTTADVPLGDRVNMVYMGTLVTGGQGLAVVVATAQFTEMGRIQTLVGEATLPETPMQKQLDQASSQLVLVSGAVCGVVFGIGLLRGYGVLQMLKTSISLAVAAVPEGLPTVATTTLALGIRDMRKHKVLIRRLDAVETLGCVQSLCLDKTGTLTENRMSVVALCIDTRRIKVSEGQLRNGEELINPDNSDQLLKLIHILVLCNESEINGVVGEYAVRGSSTENALIDLALALGVDAVQVRQMYPLLKVRHRSEAQNFMRTHHATPETKKLIAVKGSPSEVLTLCNWQLQNNRIVPLTELDRQGIELENEYMAGNALRVLGAAYVYTEDPDADQEHLVWLGLVGMADPIRTGVKELMGIFHQAGIETVMITGDQSPTAYAIGKELDLSQGEQLEILDSTHLTNLDADVMQALCQRAQVFARVSPAYKLQIVQALQQAGRVVAMTGDGINDAPALKAADVGVAMGVAGTDVAREVADVVLEDDNLQTMAIAVSRGRTIYNNIRKSVHYLLSTNLSEITVMFVGTSLGIGQPLNAMQLLWLNLVTDVFPALALALEPPEPDVLSQPPRNPQESIIKASDFKRITFESATLTAGTLGAYGYGIVRYGIGPQASTLAFMALTVEQLVHAISCRSKTQSIFSRQPLPPNPYLAIALGGSLALQLLAVVIPGLRGLLKVTPINPLDGFVIGGSALLPLLVNEGTKGWGDRRVKRLQPSALKSRHATPDFSDEDL
jgi:Ca2+-transporting ATPase